MLKKKNISAATFFTNGKVFLAIHPTNIHFWEIPKGMVDKEESDDKAAVREFYEETNVQLNQFNLKKIGKFKLHETKDIMLFLYVTDTLPDVSTMKCTSYFRNKGNPLPEVEDWAYVKIKDMQKWIRQDMQNMLRKLISKEI